MKQAMAPVTIGMGSSEAGDGPSYNRDVEQRSRRWPQLQ